MFDSQRKTANLFDLSAYYSVDSGITDITINGSSLTYNVSGTLRAIRYRFALNPSDVYTISLGNNSSKVKLELRYIKDGEQVGGSINIAIGESRTITGSSSYDHFLIYISNGSNTGECIADKIMLNTGSTPLPYEPYGWVHSLRKLDTSTDTITTLPADVYADGNNATVGLKGQMVQSSTPSPTTPIQPQECGERTGNLFNGTIVQGAVTDAGFLTNATTRVRGEYIPVQPNSRYTLSIDQSIKCIYAYNNQERVELIFSIGTTGRHEQAFTTPDNCNSVCIAIMSNEGPSTDITPQDVEFVMLNVGSTALPYEPWGIKIPISSANTTTPVYLGEVESTRRIYKYEFTGQEEWKSLTADPSKHYLAEISPDYMRMENIITYICSHYSAFPQTSSATSVPNLQMSMAYSTTSQRLYIADANYTIDADFKAYLAQQYANGTPVTVWYILTTPTTGIVNEPLRKIGDYADTVSGITIPTISGKDSFDVLTTLKPSEVSLAYTGWHDATVKEWDGSEW